MSVMRIGCLVLAGLLLTALPGCHRHHPEPSIYGFWAADSLDVAPGSYRTEAVGVDGGMRTVPGFEDSVSLRVACDVRGSDSVGCYVVTTENMNRWLDSLPFGAIDSQAFLPRVHGADLTVRMVPNGVYHVILDNRDDTTGHRVANLRCEVTFWKYVP